MVPSGSVPWTVAFSTYTREGRMFLRSLTVSRVMTLKLYLRIVKAMFGLSPSMASTAFATSPSLRFP